jgi:hypothetical protein
MTECSLFPQGIRESGFQRQARLKDSMEKSLEPLSLEERGFVLKDAIDPDTEFKRLETDARLMSARRCVQLYREDLANKR